MKETFTNIIGGLLMAPKSQSDFDICSSRPIGICFQQYVSSSDFKRIMFTSDDKLFESLAFIRGEFDPMPVFFH